MNKKKLKELKSYKGAKPIKEKRDPKRLKHKWPYAYCIVIYQSVSGHIEKIWNGRDGGLPILINGKNGQEMRIKNPCKKYLPNHAKHMKIGERYIATMTKERAKYLARWIVRKRWKVALYKAYDTKSEARFLLFKSYFGDGDKCTILQHGKDVTTYTLDKSL